MTGKGIVGRMSLAALAAIFYVVFVIFSLAAFLLRKDLLEFKRGSKASYWHSRPEEALDRQQCLRQY